jgi:hypothetical protein
VEVACYKVYLKHLESEETEEQHPQPSTPPVYNRHPSSQPVQSTPLNLNASKSPRAAASSAPSEIPPFKKKNPGQGDWLFMPTYDDDGARHKDPSTATTTAKTTPTNKTVEDFPAFPEEISERRYPPGPKGKGIPHLMEFHVDGTIQSTLYHP